MSDTHSLNAIAYAVTALQNQQATIQLFLATLVLSLWQQVVACLLNCLHDVGKTLQSKQDYKNINKEY